eukprot:TRINITY_DN629_c0_g1_i1.p1 TRINITY_DN629_c0_g1~~TRINITY_DN629_c0_g1_i1.p1  ORF type:complete len:1040 (-),score=124.45 TRINITY_DN629_c0_g1_i1:3267-6386(-)
MNKTEDIVSSSSSAPLSFTLRGTEVTFPYPPYDQQRQYMEAVIEACEENKNALLESPTGTGKTLSLLCSSLAWVKAKRQEGKDNAGVRILYLSRTHSQLMQVVKELKKTIYAPITATLASRDQLCVNEEAKQQKGSQRNLWCKRAKKLGTCPYRRSKGAMIPDLKDRIMDVEELFEFGRKRQICPYYAARELIVHADLVLMPYNYLLDHNIRANIKGLQYTNSIIIFDEAHNVHRVSEEASSFQISLGELRKCLEEIRVVQKIYASVQSGETIYNDLKKQASELNGSELVFVEDTIHNFMEYLQKYKDSEERVYEGRKLFSMFLEGTEPPKDAPVKQKSNVMAYNSLDKYFTPARPCRPRLLEKYGGERGITCENSHMYTQILKKCVEILATKNAGTHLDMWCKTVSTVFYYMHQDQGNNSENSQAVEKQIDDFKVVVSDESEGGYGKKEDKAKQNKSDPCIKVYCLNPGIGFANLIKAKPRSIILTSGTLSPMDSLESELRMSFPVKLENSHVIESDQILLQIITHDSFSHPFNFDYKHREGTAQIHNLGKLMKDICLSTPGGILVFFSCYSMLKYCLKEWKPGIIPSIEKTAQKKVFKEDKTTTKNQRVIETYRNRIVDGKGAVLFAVCRGKISEGLDFADDASRTVIVIGIPFPSIGDRRVLLRREYLDQHKDKLHLSGKEWYTQEAVRAINQAIGRCIRHKNDYGTILLVDARFGSGEIRPLLSKWLRDRVNKPKSTEECIENLKEFFNKMQAKNFPRPPKVEKLPTMFKTKFGNPEVKKQRKAAPAAKFSKPAVKSFVQEQAVEVSHAKFTTAKEMKDKIATLNQLDAFYYQKESVGTSVNNRRRKRRKAEENVSGKDQLDMFTFKERKNSEVAEYTHNGFEMSRSGEFDVNEQQAPDNKTNEEEVKNVHAESSVTPSVENERRLTNIDLAPHSEKPKKDMVGKLIETAETILGKKGARELSVALKQQCGRKPGEGLKELAENVVLLFTSYVTNMDVEKWDQMFKLTEMFIKKEWRKDYKEALQEVIQHKISLS